MERDLSAKVMDLERGLAALPGAAIAYSGGVDSAFLTAAAHRFVTGEVLAVTAVSPSLAESERTGAESLAKSQGWRHRFVDTAEVGREEYARNAPDRCYWCKVELFEVLGPIAAELGVPVLVGTNLDDLGDHRPGGRAARENGVLTPLVSARLTKSDVRWLSLDWGLPTHDKPASPCLSSRIAYGVRVTPERLRRIDAGEALVRSLGFTELRVRDLGTQARVEVSLEEVPAALALTDEIEAGLKGLGWESAYVDPSGYRRGAMNEVLGDSIEIRR